MHDKEIFFNDETIDQNLIHLLGFFEAEPQKFNEEMIFSLDSL